MEQLAGPIRERLSATRGRHWTATALTVGARRVAGRIQKLIGNAARLRQAERLSRLERILEFVARGHTAGEDMLIERLGSSSDDELETVLGRLAPARMDWEGLEVRLTGMILFDSPASLTSYDGATPNRPL